MLQGYYYCKVSIFVRLLVLYVSKTAEKTAEGQLLSNLTAVQDITTDHPLVPIPGDLLL